MIKLTISSNEKAVYLNPNLIRAVAMGKNDLTTLYFDEDDYWTVKETVLEVMIAIEKFNRERKSI